MVEKTRWERLKGYFFDEGSPIQIDKVKRIEVHYEEIGSTGVESYSGYTQEEYLSTLQGYQRAKEFDKIRRSDGNIKMLLSAVRNPIAGAPWAIEPSDNTDQQKVIAAFIDHVLFKDMDVPWDEKLGEILTFCLYGHSVFEVTHKVVLGHPIFGDYNGIQCLGWRSPKTIDRWNLDKNGKLLSISQQAYGDLERLVDIPAKHLLIFTIDKEGDNYEGISLIRACYGAYKRKNKLLIALGIGSEKHALPTPTVEIPEGKDNSTQLSKLKEVMQKWVNHQAQYITLPMGWKINWNNSNFDAEKIITGVEFENQEMVRAFLANFLSLGQGQSSSGGSYALSFDQSDFFLGGIEYIANLICGEINKNLIPQLVKMNFGPQPSYPRLRCSGIRDKAGKELAEVVSMLIEKKAIIPDNELEKDLRKRYKLPEASLEGQRKQEEPKPFVPFSEIKLAEPKKQIKEDKEEVLQVMQTFLEDISESMIEDIMSAWRALPESKRFDAIKDLKSPGVREYQAAMESLFTEISKRAIDQARKETPNGKNVRFSESLKFFEFKDLPSDLQKRLSRMLQVLIGTQMSDLNKKLSFAYLSSVDSTDSEKLLTQDLEEAATAYVMGPSVVGGSGTLTAQVVNEARNAFFEEIPDEIESFVFTNGDPVSPICQALAGTVFSKDDPDYDRYHPPLHHNCKSYWTPQFKGQKNRDITEKDKSWRTDIAKAEGSITLSEDKTITQAIQISKKLAFNWADAERIAKEFCSYTGAKEESEFAYRFTFRDAGEFQEGTLRTFEPCEGVTLFLGNLKTEPLAMAEGSWSMQSVVVSKDKAKSVSQAKKLAKELGAESTDKVDETEDSYRFRQLDPSEFSVFRTKKIEAKGVSLIYGKRK